MTGSSKPVQPRTIRISDVLKALEIAADRLGDIDQSCATLRAWAAAGRVTPAGQVLTVEAVDAGIAAWRAMRQPPSEKQPVVSEKEAETAGRKPATPQTAAPLQAKRGALAVAPAAAPSEAGRPAKKAKGKDRLTADDRKESKDKLPVEDRKEERRKTAGHLSAMASQRLVEVLDEINGHMTEIVKRSGPDAVAQWEAKLSAPEVERRELYSRLVHAEPDPDVSPPEDLNAELMAHQVEGLEWLASLYANNLHGILADEMGLGKTIQTIALLLYLQESKGNRGPHLIVAPKSCLSNWQAEFARFAPGFKVFAVTGTTDEREVEMGRLREEASKGSPIACVTNYEQVYRNESLLQMSWQLVVVDEGHRLKNPETVLHNAMKQLRCRMRLLLTGTPLQNGLNELWALLHYLLPELFTQLMDFKSWFSRPFQGMPGLNEYEIQLDPQQEQQVIMRMHALLSPFLLQRLKKDVLGDSLPPRIEFVVRVPLSEWQAAVYSDLEKRTIRLLGDDSTVSSEQINNALMQLRKIVLHPYLFQDEFDKGANMFRASGKMEALDRLLAKLLRFGHKVLIFSQFTSMLDVIEGFLAWRDIPSVRLDGKVSHEQRGERMKRFQEDPKIPVFLLSSRAGSLGLNLQAADTVILFDMDWNPQNDKQAVARVHRVGQTKEVRVVRLLTDAAVERHMEQRCQEKLDMEQKIMGAGMFRRAATADQRRQALRAVLGLEPSPSASSGASEPASGCTSIEEVNRQLARSAAELKAFAEMDAAIFGAASTAASQSLADLLVSHGRLMKAEEVPAGFSAVRGEES